MLKMIPILMVLFLSSVFAQNIGYNPKDADYKLLSLKRFKEQFEVQKANYERQKALHDKGMISDTELGTAKTALSSAEADYQESLLSVIFEKQYISVLDAIKYQGKDGKKHVKLTLANTSEEGGEFQKLINIDDALFRSLQPDVVNNVYVSLLNADGAIISRPYEPKIPQIKAGTPVTIDFVILQDLDAVTVSLIYANGSTRSAKIYLQKDLTENKVVLQSEQFSQECELGKNTTYNMTLELFSGSSNTFKLEVVNLPKQITHYFVDAATNTKLNEFRFTQATETKKAGLQVYLPDRSTGEVVTDKKITFYVLVIPNEKVEALGDLQNRNLTKEEIEKMNIGYLKLELVPKGAGKVNVRAQQLYFAASSGEKVTVPVDIINEGTKRLDNVEFDIDLPINWTKEINPKIVDAVGIREEKRVEFTFTPPADISPGKYEIRVKTTSMSDNEVVKAEDKTITVEIKQSVSIIGTLVIVLLIIGVVAGIVIFGIKLTRR